MDQATINLMINLAAIVLGGGAFGVYLVHRREKPKAKAEAANKKSEADDRDWGRFQKEIGRLEERISRIEHDNDELRDDALKSRQRESNLEQKIRSQKAHIDRLERRLIGMERIFNVNGVTPEMRAALDQLEQVAITECNGDGK